MSSQKAKAMRGPKLSLSKRREIDEIAVRAVAALFPGGYMEKKLLELPELWEAEDELLRQRKELRRKFFSYEAKDIGARSTVKREEPGPSSRVEADRRQPAEEPEKKKIKREQD